MTDRTTYEEPTTTEIIGQEWQIYSPKEHAGEVYVTQTIDQGVTLILMQIERFTKGATGGIRYVPVLLCDLKIWEGPNG